MSRDFISSWVLLLYPRAPVEDQLSAGKPRKVAATLCSGSGMKAEKCCLVVVLSHSLTVFCLANPILTIPVQLSGHWNKRLRAAVECAIAVASNCACDARFPSAAGFHRTLPAALAFQGTDVDQCSCLPPTGTPRTITSSSSTACGSKLVGFLWLSGVLDWAVQFSSSLATSWQIEKYQHSSGQHARSLITVS